MRGAAQKPWSRERRISRLAFAVILFVRMLTFHLGPKMRMLRWNEKNLTPKLCLPAILLLCK